MVLTNFEVKQPFLSSTTFNYLNAESFRSSFQQEPVDASNKQQQQQQSYYHMSSNGYYGFQPVSVEENFDCEMALNCNNTVQAMEEVADEGLGYVPNVRTDVFHENINAENNVNNGNDFSRCQQTVSSPFRRKRSLEQWSNADFSKKRRCEGNQTSDRLIKSDEIDNLTEELLLETHGVAYYHWSQFNTTNVI